MRKCKYCGEENPDNKNWCKKCMKPLRDDSAEALPLSPEKTTSGNSVKFGTIRRVTDDSGNLSKYEDKPNQKKLDNHGRLYGSMGPKIRALSEENVEKGKSEQESTSGLKGRMGHREYGREEGSNNRNIRSIQRYCTGCGEPVDGEEMLCLKCRNRKQKGKTIWLGVVAVLLVIATSVFIEDSVTSIGSGSFDNYEDLVNITIPDGVKTIKTLTFYGCSKLESITLPQSISVIESGAFENCEKLSNVYYGGSQEEWNTIKVEENNEDLLNATIHHAIEDDINAITGICGDNLRWTLKNGVLTIFGTGKMYDYDLLPPNASPWYDFRDSITEIRIGDKVTYIGKYAFNNCFNVQSITIPGNVETIGDNAFFFCTGLRNLVIEKGVKHIGNSAFHECCFVTSIKLPDSITTIGDYAFWNCRISDIVMPPNLESIGNNVFEMVDSNLLVEVHFTGHAPKFAFNTFFDVNATVGYPANDRTWTREVMQDYGGDITWVPEGFADQSGKELSAYRPIVEQTMRDSGYSTAYSYTQTYCQGILLDLDGDGVKELVLQHLSDSNPNLGADYLLSVYDYENGKVVARLKDVSFGSFGVAGSDGYVTIVYKAGTPYIMTHRQSGETSGSDSVLPNRTEYVTLYDGKTYQKAAYYWIDRYKNVMSYEIDGKSISENKFIKSIETYDGIDVICDMYELIEAPENLITASKLLKQLK